MMFRKMIAGRLEN